MIERSGPAMTDLTNALEMLRDVARTRLCRIADHEHLPAEQITCAGLPAPEQAGYVDQELDCALVRNGRIVDQKCPYLLRQAAAGFFTVSGEVGLRCSGSYCRWSRIMAYRTSTRRRARQVNAAVWDLPSARLRS